MGAASEVIGREAELRELADRSRHVHYPSCEAVNLHTLADAAVLDGQLGHAAALLIELVDGLVARGAHSELRNGLRTAAVVLQRAGEPGWSDLAATANALPAVSVFTVPGHERLKLPAGGGRVLAPRDAVSTCRRGIGHADRDAVAALAHLLSSPGTEVHSLDLMDGAVEETSTGEVIDPRARRDWQLQ